MQPGLYQTLFLIILVGFINGSTSKSQNYCVYILQKLQKAVQVFSNYFYDCQSQSPVDMMDRSATCHHCPRLLDTKHCGSNNISIYKVRLSCRIRSVVFVITSGTRQKAGVHKTQNLPYLPSGSHLTTFFQAQQRLCIFETVVCPDVQ